MTNSKVDGFDYSCDMSIIGRHEKLAKLRTDYPEGDPAM